MQMVSAVRAAMRGTRARIGAALVAGAVLVVGVAASPAAADNYIGGNCNFMQEQFAVSYSVKIPRYDSGNSIDPCWLDRGDKGIGVTALQRAYNICYKARYEPAIAEDGSFGATTEDRVKVMQRREGIAADGIAGELTKNSIKWPLYSQTTGAFLWCWEKW